MSEHVRLTSTLNEHFQRLLHTYSSPPKIQASHRLTRFNWLSHARPTLQLINFMQPEPAENVTAYISEINSEQPATSQYGFRPHNFLSAELRPQQQGENDAPNAPSDVSSSSFKDESFDHGSRLSMSRQTAIKSCPDRIDEYKNILSSSSAHRIAPVHRIADGETENTLPSAPSRKHSEGPKFNIAKSRVTMEESIIMMEERPQLDTLPNEVLTHIMSHLPASSLSRVARVSKRFHTLVTTPHPWRIAFSRFFPGQDVIECVPDFQGSQYGSNHLSHEHVRSEQRFFTRLTAIASWRSEYILRTRLLRSLEQGKPAQISARHGEISHGTRRSNPAVTYNSRLFSTINHIHGTFSNGQNSPRFIHGTDETGHACTSDPASRKVKNWGFPEPQSLAQFVDLFPGDQPFGLGAGLVVGAPNVMDVSLSFGLVYGEGFPGGRVYFHASEETSGRFLADTIGASMLQAGIPQIPHVSESVCSVWLAKSSTIPDMTESLVGIMTGSSCGVITTYSLGVDNLVNYRVGKGEITSRWIISPGVPIIAISVDECYNNSRKVAGRIWAVALNALGEIYYLTETPRRSYETAGRVDEGELLVAAWETGRNAFWNLVEPTRRVARYHSYQKTEFDGGYSPRSGSRSVNLSKEQLVAETREIEKFLALKPAHFRKFCHGWDMQRILEVDFTGDDGKGAGESMIVIDRGIQGSIQAQINRYTRLKSEQTSFGDCPLQKTPPTSPPAPSITSLFGGEAFQTSSQPTAVAQSPKRSTSPNDGGNPAVLAVQEWRKSLLSLGGLDGMEILTCAMDMSKLAMLTSAEDPLLVTNGDVTKSIPFVTPALDEQRLLSDIPGYRARYVGVGTKSGSIVLWNARGPPSANSEMVNELQPVRIIQTESPQISCLALSSLYIVHGGNDGLVQAWDPLASTIHPIRTLNSRFPPRARRRLVQGVDINPHAAGAICLDPDPTVLRGIASIGTHLRYWSYRSTVIDRPSSKRRKTRRPGDRASNVAPVKITNTGRGVLIDYIAEQEELRKEIERDNKEHAHLRGRFGVGLHGLSDEEALRYAEMISQEEFQKDEERRMSELDRTPSSSIQSASVFNSNTSTPEGSVVGPAASPKNYDTYQLDHDINEAIRLSLLDGVDEEGRSPRDSGIGEYGISITYKQTKSRRSASSSPSTSQASKSRAQHPYMTCQGEPAMDDPEFALKLSHAEQQTGTASGADEFPRLKETCGGKGRGRPGAV